MEKLSSTPSSSSAKLSGLAEDDEFYIKAGLKGRRYHEKIVKPGRNLGKECSPCKDRGSFYKDRPMIARIHQKNAMTYFDVPLYRSLLGIIYTRIEYGSTIVTDEYRVYDHLEEHGFKHKSVIHSQKE